MTSWAQILRRIGASVVAATFGFSLSTSAQADYFVFKLEPPISDDFPTLRFTAKKPDNTSVDFSVAIDTGDGISTNGGLYLNNSTATNLGLDLSKGTGSSTAGVGGTANIVRNVPMPASFAFKQNPMVPSGQVAQAPTLPAGTTVGPLPAGTPGLIGSEFLSTFQYGRTKGDKGGFFWMSAATEGPNAQKSALSLAIDSANSKPVNKAADGRPEGTKAAPISPKVNPPSPSGALPFDGGWDIGIRLAYGPTVIGGIPFLIDSGLSTSLISDETALALGIDQTTLETLPTMFVQSDFGQMQVREATLNLDLFGTDPSFSFTILAGITDPTFPNSPFGDQNPYRENFLGGDILGQLAYWEVDGQSFDSSGPLFYAARTFTPASEPAAVALFALGALVLSITRRKGSQRRLPRVASTPYSPA